MRRSRSLLRPGAVIAAAAVVALLVFVPAAGSAAGSVTITPSIDGIVGSNGWYRGSTYGDFVVLHWTIDDPGNTVVSTSGCEAALKVDGPTTGTSRTCSATTNTSTVVSSTVSIKIDADPPTDVVALPSRPPDANGWYNHPLAITWTGHDATSGLGPCTSTTYSGPDSGSGTLAGGCLDNAGNGATAGFNFKYDSTPPVLAKVSVQSGANADVVHWKSSSPTDTAVVERIARGRKSGPTVFHGSGTSFADAKVRAGTEYRYLVRTYDQAGNASKQRAVSALPKVVTLGPNAYVPRTAARPILRLPRVAGASYYHVQLFRHGTRILAVWPLAPRLSLRGAWTWGGRRYRLTAGRYRWFAWAGFGPRTAARYKLLGHGDFAIG